jgi:hypothetical protein
MTETSKDAAAFRRWTVGVVGCVGLFVIGNFLLWVTSTGNLFLPAPSYGDLARVGYYPALSVPRHEVCTLPKRQLTFDDDPVGIAEVVTIGDSISRGRGAGLNNYYQDHISSIYGLNTLHLFEQRDADYFEAAVIACNSGLLKKLGAKHLVLQSMERHAVDRFGRDPNWSSTRPLEQLWGYFVYRQEHKAIALYNRQALDRDVMLKEHGALGRLKAWGKQFFFMHIYRPDFVEFQEYVRRTRGYAPWENDPIVTDGLVTDMPKAMNANMKYLIHRFVYWFDLKGRQSIAQLYTLDRPLFADSDGREFLVHVGDLRNQVLAERPGWMEKMHENLNRLAKLLKAEGVTLHVMIAPNKLTVYQPYLTDKSVPRSIFFDRMRSFTDRDYEFVDTEKVIADLISRGEKDVYFAGDSHWSGKPLDGIVRSMRFGPTAVAAGRKEATDR